jgi:cell division protein ZapA (FtsZ GTPase activity inhibitor)
MPELTVEQSDELANQALSLKRAVGDFRNRFFDTLTPEQRDGLRTLAMELGNEVDHLTAVAIKLSLVDLQGALAHLREITSGVNNAVAHLSEVRKVITVATALVGLGAAIASVSPSAVLSALRDTVTSIQT